MQKTWSFRIFLCWKAEIISHDGRDGKTEPAANLLLHLSGTLLRQGAEREMFSKTNTFSPTESAWCRTRR